MTMPSFEYEKFPIAPAGEDVFMVDAVDYVEEKNAYKLTYRLLHTDIKHVEYYRRHVKFQTNALGNMLRAAYNNKTLKSFNASILIDSIGRQFKGKIVHREYEGNTYAGIDAFSYKPVTELYSFAKESVAIQDEETIA